MEPHLLKLDFTRREALAGIGAAAAIPFVATAMPAFATPAGRRSDKAAGRSCCSSSRPLADGNGGSAQPERGGGCRDENGLQGALPGREKSLRAWNAKARVKSGAACARVHCGVGSYIGTPVQVAIGRNPALLSSSDRLYLDHAATTPVLPGVMTSMRDALDRWANPNSPHAEGRAARAALEDARSRIKAAFAWDGDLIFTSGATEALSIALSRSERSVLASAVEHDAVFRAAPAATVLPIGANSEVDRDALRDALAALDSPLVAIQHVNSETGIEQPIDALARDIRESGGLLVCDCSQSAAKIPLPDADMLIVSAHKLGGPPGIGALLLRSLEMIKPVGGQEFGYRAGTQNVPAAVGFATAVEQFKIGRFSGRPRDALPVVKWLYDLAYPILDLEYPMTEAGGVYQPTGGMRLSSVQAWTMPGMSAAAQLVRFDSAGISVSAGSACSSGSMKPSRALTAFGISEEEAACTIRVSFGWSTTTADVGRFLETWLDIAGEVRARAA
jgi:cysteine desulfurase